MAAVPVPSSILLWHPDELLDPPARPCCLRSVRAGSRAAVYRTGPGGGVAAVVDFTADAVARPGGGWAADGEVRLLDHPLPRPVLLADDVLGPVFRTLRGRRGLPEEAGRRLADLLERDRRPDARRRPPPCGTMTSVIAPSGGPRMDNDARRMWELFEPVHAVTYFAPEARAAADALGMRGFWMGYVAQRIAPLGAVGPDVAVAAFFGFHADRIRRALPDAWALTTPDAALDARSAGAAAALHRLGGDVEPEGIAEAADLAWQAAAAADCAGRVLAAANQALPRPASPLPALWQATATLREHRGDGHNAVLVARGIPPVAAHLIKGAAGEADPEVLREGRRFGEDAWRDGIAGLRADGILDAANRLTDTGRRLHTEIEDATDAAAAAPWRELGPTATARLATLLRPLAAAVVTGGTLPMPNAVGLVLAP